MSAPVTEEGEVVELTERLERAQLDLAFARERLAYFTECQIATQHGAEDRKTTPAYERKRLASISDAMVDACVSLGLRGDETRPGPRRGAGPRLMEALRARAATPEADGREDG